MDDFADLLAAPKDEAVEYEERIWCRSDYELAVAAASEPGV
jgi:hypothetical protein